MLCTTLCALIAVSGCHRGTSSKSSEKTSPAKVEHHPDEANAYLVELTPKAVERLGITTAAVERRTMERRRVLAGELLVPVGRRYIVTAPVDGTLAPPQDGELPSPGTRIDVGQLLFTLKPLLTPERDVPTPAERVQMANAKVGLVSAQIIADGEVESLAAEVEGAKIALTRAKKLLEDRAGSRRQVDEAQATLDVAEKRLAAAKARKEALDELTLDGPVEGELRTIPIAAPEPGVLQTLSVARGQMVTAGTPLLELVNLDRLWIRLPVYVGQAEEFDTQAACEVLQLDGTPLPSPRMAEPIDAPPSADPLTSTLDLYYRVDNVDGLLLPGERIGVSLPLRDETGEFSTVPWAAVLHDVHGTQWVYERVEEHAFQRRRVLVRYVDGDTAVLARGPEEGTIVVVDGVAELFGTEFGAGH